MLHAQQVNVTEHKLDSTRGSIRYHNHPGYIEEAIQGDLNKYKVTVHKKIITRNQANPNQLYIITVDSCVLPSEVHIGCTPLKDEEYINRPRRCFQYQKWGA